MKIKFCDNDELMLLLNSCNNVTTDNDKDDQDEIITFGIDDTEDEENQDVDHVDIDQENTETNGATKDVNHDQPESNGNKKNNVKVYDGLPEINGKAKNNGDAIEVDE